MAPSTSRSIDGYPNPCLNWWGGQLDDDQCWSAEVILHIDIEFNRSRSTTTESIFLRTYIACYQRVISVRLFKVDLFSRADWDFLFHEQSRRISRLTLSTDGGDTVSDRMVSIHIRRFMLRSACECRLFNQVWIHLPDAALRSNSPIDLGLDVRQLHIDPSDRDRINSPM